MKKNLKRQINSKKIILLIVIIISLLISVVTITKTKNNNKITNIKQATNGLYTNNIGNVDIDITNQVASIPNNPQVSAGMIPIKWNGDFWEVVDASDSSWYNYENGKLATIMLNDGKYASEKNLAGKEIAKPGIEIKDNELGTMFTWIPRYAYNNNNEKIYLKAVSRNFR